MTALRASLGGIACSPGRAARGLSLAVGLVASTAGCFGDDPEKPPPVSAPPAAAPGPGFAAKMVLVATTERTPLTLALLSVDERTGALGLLPGSPIDVGAQTGDFETLAVDVARRRVFVGGSNNGRIAVVTVDGRGAVKPVPGSPFIAQGRPSALALSHDGRFLWVGHEGPGISAYAVHVETGALSPVEGSPFTLPGRHVENLLLSGDWLFVGCRVGSYVAALRVDRQTGKLALAGEPVLTEPRPDHLRVIGDRLYCSLAEASAIDAFAIDRASGALARLPGAPYRVPGLKDYELIEVHPDGKTIAAGVCEPPCVALFDVEEDGSLASKGSPAALHGGLGGPEGMEWSRDGRFLYVASHLESADGIYVLEYLGPSLVPADPFRYRIVAGGQIDLALVPLEVAP